jgi:hypothetical protein
MSEGSEVPPLLADAMLGKLARWLRLLGYDTVYMHDEDIAIAYRARAEGRVLLTRDRELAKRRGLETVLVEAQQLEPQLAQVVGEVGRPPAEALPRCMECNAPLEEITREEARPHVPPYVARTQHEFRRCPKCGRITWPGTHWEGIRQRLDRVLRQP